MAVVTVLVAVGVILLIGWIISIEKKRWKFDKLGGPKGYPIFGNALQLKRDPGAFTEQFLNGITKEFRHLGVFKITILGKLFLLVCSPEEAEKLLNSSKHLDKSEDYRFMYPWIGLGLLTSTGEKWKKRRKMLTPTFHFKILHDFVDVFNDQAKVLMKKFEAAADSQTKINVFTDITLCVLDIICETAMGQSVNAQLHKDSEYVKAVHGASRYTFVRTRTPWYWPKFLFDLLGPGKQFDHCLTVLHNFTEKVIRERQKQSSEQDSKLTMEQLLEEKEEFVVTGRKQRLAFLDMLLCASEDGEKLSFMDIREEVDTFMFEGHDTTAVSTTWALHLIGADPEIQTKVQEELYHIFGDSDRDATMEDLKEMRYLECCIKEALRIFPSVPVFGRSLTEETELGGVNVPKGTTTLIIPWSIHMDETIFPDPERYDPDRFLPENCQNRHPYAFIPFSAGSRNCIGQKFAILEEKVLLSMIFRQFNVKSTQTREELNPWFELMLRPSNGIDVIFTKRQK